MTISKADTITDAHIEQGRLIFAGDSDFVLGAVALEHLPSDGLMEVAFAGRSNVGKSSLINALTGRKALARTSNTPGRTQQLNFFKLGQTVDHPFYIVDLPGYGYAKVSKTQVGEWTELMKDYLRGRPNLRRVFLLIDSRHGLKENDKEIMKMLDVAAVSYQLVLTKADKIKAAGQKGLVERIAQEAKPFVACHPEIILTSSEKKSGLENVKAHVAWLLQT